MGKLLIGERSKVNVKEAAKRFFRKYGVAVAVLLFLYVWTFSTTRIAAATATKETTEKLNAYWAEHYERELEAYKAEQEAAHAVEYDAALRQTEAEAVARVLYGVKGNSERDLRTLAWCIFNRVDNKAYPNTLNGVISQPSQWMAYSEDNAVLDGLYDIAKEEIDRWHSGHRPVSSEFVYMNWSPSEIVLRNRWEEKSGTKYWQWGESNG